MSRMVKELVCDQFKRRYAELDSALAVSIHGLTGNEVNRLRTKLSEDNTEVHVVQNRLVRRALIGTALEPLGRALSGPCALVTGENTIGAAKELVRLVKEFPALELKYGLLDGEDEVLSVEAISLRKSLQELQGEVVMLAASPGRRIAGCLQAGGKIAGCLKAISEKLEKGEAISKVA